MTDKKNLKVLPRCFSQFKIIIIELNFIINVISFESHLICDRIPGLRSQQKTICVKSPQSLLLIAHGLRMASEECQQQFQHQRWNCSTFKELNIFTNLILRGTREASFFQAIRSAGLTFAITEACNRGNIGDCGCHPIRTELSSDAWKWLGCSANIDYGTKLSKIFIDSEEYERNSRSLMNLHNNNVGRKCVRDLLISRCKCHGVSGSCTSRTCWKTLPPFRAIGDNLMKKYENAKRVSAQFRSKSGSKTKLFLKLKQISSNQRKHKSLPEIRDLVYLEKSNNYCDENLSADSLGTRGRLCNNTSNRSDGCHSLCCGRGYNTHRYTIKWKCNCLFKFCCSVNCQECSQIREQYFCK